MNRKKRLLDSRNWGGRTSALRLGSQSKMAYDEAASFIVGSSAP